MGMSFLLDTHVLLWALMEPAKLSARAREMIEETDNELWVSSASAWEIATKHRLGRLPEAEAVVAGYERQLARLGCRELPIRAEHALRAGAFPAEHRDPFDRMLAAQALCEGVPIVSRDTVLELFRVPLVW